MGRRECRGGATNIITMDGEVKGLSFKEIYGLTDAERVSIRKTLDEVGDAELRPVVVMIIAAQLIDLVAYDAQEKKEKSVTTEYILETVSAMAKESRKFREKKV